MDRITFGTYKKNKEGLAELLEASADIGIGGIDCAQLYNNEAAVGDYLKTVPVNKKPYVTTKIYKDLGIEGTLASIKNSIAKLGYVNRVLLHRPLPLSSYLGLELALEQGLIESIGVSNYSIQNLEVLLASCKIKPDVIQIEIHPFVEVQQLLNFCKHNDIKVQAHTVLAKAQFFDYPPLVQLASKLSVSVVSLLISWCLHLNVDVVLSTSKMEHFNQWEQGTNIQLSESDVSVLNGMYTDLQHRFYKFTKLIDSKLPLTKDSKQLVKVITKTFQSDVYNLNNNLPVSEACIYYFKKGVRHLNQDSTMVQVALNLFPNQLEDDIGVQRSCDKFMSLIKKLRTRYYHQTSQLKSKKGKGLIVDPDTIKRAQLTCPIKDPQPMPVTVMDPNDLNPIVKSLTDTRSELSHPKTFTKGTLFPDGRIDMCKQVVGPKLILPLCQAVGSNLSIKHFLLGNNVAGLDGSSVAAKAIVDMVQENPSLETLYLAGNCLDSESIQVISQGLAQNTSVNALWLKRNPVREQGCLYLNKLLTANFHLQLLDLHNCAINDKGLENLLHFSANHSDFTVHLKHLYLDANNLTAKSGVTLANFFSKFNSELESLYLSMNQLGDEGVESLVQGLVFNQKLKRLELGSNKLTDSCIQKLVQACFQLNQLNYLGLTTYKATYDLGQLPNFFTDKCIPILAELVLGHPTLKCLGLDSEGLESVDFQLLESYFRNNQFLLYRKPNDNLSKLHKETIQKFRHPDLVKNIESVYRGKM